MRFFVIVTLLFTVAAGVFASPVVQRDTLASVASILTELSNEVASFADQLLYTNRGNATVENLASIIDQISISVTSAIDNLNSLSGKATTATRASSDSTETLGASDIANLLGEIVTLLFQAIGVVLKVVDPSLYTEVSGLLTALAKIICSLIAVLVTLITGLAPLLVDFIGPILSIVAILGLTSSLGAILGIVL